MCQDTNTAKNGSITENLDEPDNGGQGSPTIVLMGMSGTGKSSFIKLLTGDKDIKIGMSMNPETRDISTYQVINDGSEVTIVDTPSFDDCRPHMSDSKLLEDTTKFLLKRLNTNSLQGLIYLHRISDVRIDGTAIRNLDMFSRLCGPDAMKNVVILTTRWDETRLNVAQRTETELINTYFKGFIDSGAQVLRHKNTVESAREVIAAIIDRPPIAHLQVINEMMSGRSLLETEAGRVLDSLRLQKIRETLERLKATKLALEDPKVRDARLKQFFDDLLAKHRARMGENLS